MTKVRGLRGATTSDTDSRHDILTATENLLKELIKANDLRQDDVAAAFFTTTPDLHAEYPAAAARLMGWTNVALMGASEIDVPNAPPLCIRILLLINTERSAEDLKNVYQKGAANLRSRGVDSD